MWMQCIFGRVENCAHVKLELTYNFMVCTVQVACVPINW